MVKRHLGPNLGPPSGKCWSDVKAKQAWWEKWSQDRARSKGREMPPAWAEPNWECFLVFGLLPGGLKYPDLFWWRLSHS